MRYLLAALILAAPVAAATCRGKDPCRACSSCKYCKLCAKGGGKCGICKPMQAPAQPADQRKVSVGKRS